MLIFIVFILALIPALAILYPFLQSLGRHEIPQDESSRRADLDRRWDSALAGLKNADLDRSLGNLSDQDYQWIREQYINEASLIMKSIELEENQEERTSSHIDPMNSISDLGKNQRDTK
tara:strand:+ start:210 stop:566 length:357 start_codon:yes stop_codon:yes gene_type:complete